MSFSTRFVKRSDCDKDAVLFEIGLSEKTIKKLIEGKLKSYTWADKYRVYSIKIRKELNKWLIR